MFAQFGDFIGSEAIKINQQDLQLISIKMAGQFLTHIWTALDRRLYSCIAHCLLRILEVYQASFV
jgi:hypothetical protein